jgi:hypothetical protein
VMRLQNWSLQQSGDLRPQEMEKNKGDRVDLPIDKEGSAAERRLHKESQPLEQLDEVIEK